jgi:Single-stranded DNA-specific exonuclease
VSLSRENIPEFAARFNKIAKRELTADDLIPEIRVDLEVPLDEVNDELEAMLRHFEPYGMGNPSPVLVSRSVRLGGAPRAIGRDGLKILLEGAILSLDAIGWGMADRIPDLPAGSVVDIAFRLERDEYQGVTRLQARIADIRIAGESE